MITSGDRFFMSSSGGGGGGILFEILCEEVEAKVGDGNSVET